MTDHLFFIWRLYTGAGRRGEAPRAAYQPTVYFAETDFYETEKARYADSQIVLVDWQEVNVNVDFWNQNVNL